MHQYLLYGDNFHCIMATIWADDVRTNPENSYQTTFAVNGKHVASVFSPAVNWRTGDV